MPFFGHTLCNTKQRTYRWKRICQPISEKLVPKRDDIDALLGGLQSLQKDVKVEEVLEQALSEPQPTEDRLNQIEQALETFQSLGLLGGDDTRDLHLLLTLGRTYERLSHLEKAFETYEKALALAERHQTTSTRGELLGRMGRVLTRWQRWDDALSCLDRSQQAYESLGDELGLAQTLVRRGTVFTEKGDYAQAQAVYESAREVGQRIQYTKTIAQAVNNLAILATIHGDFEEAVSQYEACIPLYEQIEDQRGLAGAYQNLGMAHTDHQDWTKAMDAFERGFEVAQTNGHLDLMRTFICVWPK